MASLPESLAAADFETRRRAAARTNQPFPLFVEIRYARHVKPSTRDASAADCTCGRSSGAAWRHDSRSQRSADNSGRRRHGPTGRHRARRRRHVPRTHPPEARRDSEALAPTMPGKLGLQRAEATIIDGNFQGAEGPGVKMAENSTLDGFTVTGVGEYDDDAVEKASRHARRRAVARAYRRPRHGGVAVIGVTRCTVKNNIVHHIGYTGIAIIGAEGKRVSPHIFRNVTYRNMGGGIGSMKQSTATSKKTSASRISTPASGTTTPVRW